MAAELEKLAKEFQQKGYPEFAASLNASAQVARKLGAPEQFSVDIKTPEKVVEIKKFSNEQKEALKKEGYVIYSLTGQSIKTLKDSGRKFWSTWHNSLPDFEALRSMHSEVAINPNKLFLPKSNNKTLEQQEEMVGKFSEELGKKVKGVKAIIGQAPDYVELAFQHLDATEDWSFGAKYNNEYARTKTPTSRFVVADVGLFNTTLGLPVRRWYAALGRDAVHAAPLVVSVQSR